MEQITVIDLVRGHQLFDAQIQQIIIWNQRLRATVQSEFQTNRCCLRTQSINALLYHTMLFYCWRTNNVGGFYIYNFNNFVCEYI